MPSKDSLLPSSPISIDQAVQSASAELTAFLQTLVRTPSLPDHEGAAQKLVADKFRALGLEVVDSTCPLVKNVHSVIKKYAAQGYATVIVGDKGHAEVVGLLGYAGDKSFVVAGPEEAAQLPPLNKVNIVAQTTQEEEAFLKTAEVIRSRAREAVVSDTICKPTRERQRDGWTHPRNQYI